ncbi:hypothetical protein OPKNFCMD_5011 [Methylobacterium crusticola]|uniref:Uncharacterized protein n=1 Tax=Methylobacterium crusticola TaxID=1697972 RepID=A0ABQ4R3U1_9HYPH|nr:hypothetical protein [Methylobacterium crusticola]GJD52248.1 hypothetical protein OPKNFCMD_5011 [Methylobacterium crusticola]
MASTHDAACQSCRYFDDHALNGAAPRGDEGLCRFNPPVSQPDPHGHGLWPVVAAEDWCGHFTVGQIPAE